MSGKVNRLLIGTRLEDGRDITSGSKWREVQTRIAQGQEIKIMNENEFYNFVESTLGEGTHEKEEKRRQQSMQDEKIAAIESAAKVAGKSSTTTKDTTTLLPSTLSNGQIATGSLWVDKYKPETIRDLVGNSKEILSMDEWLSKWESIHLRPAGAPPPPARPGNFNARAMLISGPPGIGKTSSANLLAKRHGYEVMELNASDARSKKLINEALGGILDSTVISFVSKQTQNTTNTGLKKRLIILDEVDGLSSADRGGNAEIAKFLRKTKVPIICICNDRQKPSVRTLANYCFDVKFGPPTTAVIAQRLVGVAKGENLSIDTDTMQQLVESVGGDLRQSLNTLQMWATTQGHMTNSEFKDAALSIGKDMTLRLDANTVCYNSI